MDWMEFGEVVITHFSKNIFSAFWRVSLSLSHDYQLSRALHWITLMTQSSLHTCRPVQSLTVRCLLTFVWLFKKTGLVLIWFYVFICSVCKCVEVRGQSVKVSSLLSWPMMRIVGTELRLQAWTVNTLPCWAILLALTYVAALHSRWTYFPFFVCVA